MCCGATAGHHCERPDAPLRGAALDAAAAATGRARPHASRQRAAQARCTVSDGKL